LADDVSDSTPLTLPPYNSNAPFTFLFVYYQHRNFLWHRVVWYAAKHWFVTCLLVKFFAQLLLAFCYFLIFRSFVVFLLPFGEIKMYVIVSAKRHFRSSQSIEPRTHSPR